MQKYNSQTEIIDYILIDLLSMKDASIITIEIVKNNLSRIARIDKYLEVLSKRLGHEHYQRMTKFVRYTTITDNYIQAEHKQIHKEALTYNKTRAYEIAQKVKQVTSVYVESEYRRNTLGHTHKQLRYESFKQIKNKSKNLFTDVEISILRSIGELGSVISLQNSSSGLDELEIALNRILDNVTLKPNTNNQISHNEKRVLGMVKRVAS